MRFRPALIRSVVAVWVIGLLAVLFVAYEKALIIPYMLRLAVNALSLLKVPSLFWELTVVRITDLVMVLLLFVSAWCIGLLLLRWFRWAERFDVFTNLFGIGLGLGVWSTCILLAGLLGWMQPWLYLSSAALSLALLGWHWPWVLRAWRTFRDRPRSQLSGYERCVVLALAIGFVLILIPSLTPEVEYDALGYHLSTLTDYRKAGEVVFLPHNSLASLPSLTEMLYLWGITLGDSSCAKLIHGAFALLIVSGLIALGKELQNRSVGLTAAALFCLLPYITTLAETARVDLATAFYGFLAGVALQRYLLDSTPAGRLGSGSDPDRSETSFLWMAALASGFSMATKYTGAAVVLVPCLVLLPMHLRGRRLGFSFFAFLLMAAIPILPWLAKNYAFTGNPVYPLAQELFHGGTTSAAPFSGPSFDRPSDWATLVRGAWDFSVKDAYASPVLLLFAPLCVLFCRPTAAWRFCACFAGLIYLFWFLLTGREWRWFCPALPWFALMGARAIAALEQDRVTGFLARAALAVTLAFNLGLSFLISALDHSDPGRSPPVMTKLAVFLGHVSPRDYVNEFFGAIGWMNDHLPDNTCVLYVGEHRTFYARHRTLSSQAYDRNRLHEFVEGCSTPQSVLERMRQRGVSHVYVDLVEVNNQNRQTGSFQELDWALFESFLRSHTRLLFQHGSHSVYGIRLNGT